MFTMESNEQEAKAAASLNSNFIRPVIDVLCNLHARAHPYVDIQYLQTLIYVVQIRLPVVVLPISASLLVIIGVIIYTAGGCIRYMSLTIPGR